MADDGPFALDGTQAPPPLPVESDPLAGLVTGYLLTGPVEPVPAEPEPATLAPAQPAAVARPVRAVRRPTRPDRDAARPVAQPMPFAVAPPLDSSRRIDTSMSGAPPARTPAAIPAMERPPSTRLPPAGGRAVPVSGGRAPVRTGRRSGAGLGCALAVLVFVVIIAIVVVTGVLTSTGAGGGG